MSRLALTDKQISHWKAMIERTLAFNSQQMTRTICRWYTSHRKEFEALEGDSVFSAIVTTDGKFCGFRPEPVVHNCDSDETVPGCSSILIYVMPDGFVKDDHTGPLVHQAVMLYRLPTWLFVNNSDYSYFMYHLKFVVHDNNLSAEPAMQQVWNGYIGVTGRHPLDRFKEHRSDALRGKGHLLHKTWHSLLRAGVGVTPAFTITGASETLKGVYALEEKWVDDFTLNPRGLNVVRGGEAGIRDLHNLSLLRGTKNVHFDHRDAALVKLEGKHEKGSPCAHYRSGHVRKISPERLTWVRPCWVNAGRRDAA